MFFNYKIDRLIGCLGHVMAANMASCTISPKPFVFSQHSAKDRAVFATFSVRIPFCSRFLFYCSSFVVTAAYFGVDLSPRNAWGFSGVSYPFASGGPPTRFLDFYGLVPLVAPYSVCFTVLIVLFPLPLPKFPTLQVPPVAAAALYFGAVLASQFHKFEVPRSESASNTVPLTGAGITLHKQSGSSPVGLPDDPDEREPNKRKRQRRGCETQSRIYHWQWCSACCHERSRINI